jgi:hypothetical protein
MEVELTLAQADVPAPVCPACNERTQQDFKPPGIVGTSARSKAEKIKDDILANDYKVGDINRSPSRPHLHYKDQSPPGSASSWQASQEMLRGAAAAGRQIRERFGSGLDVLHSNIKSGAEPDLIELSKRKAIKIW